MTGFFAKILTPIFFLSTALYVPGYKLARINIPACALFPVAIIYLLHMSEDSLSVFNKTTLMGSLIGISSLILGILLPPKDYFGIVPLASTFSIELLIFYLVSSVPNSQVYRKIIQVIYIGPIIAACAFAYFLPNWSFIVGSALMSSFLLSFALILSEIVTKTNYIIPVSVVVCVTFVAVICIQKFVWKLDGISMNDQEDSYIMKDEIELEQG